jgi:hypothetical protein
MSEVIELKDKYIRKNLTMSGVRKEPLGQNLQSDINKIDAIIKKLSEKQAASSELIRLRTRISKLLLVIDNSHQ